MSTFDQSKHPRGHHTHPGRFSEKSHSDPEVSLTTPDVERPRAVATFRREMWQGPRSDQIVELSSEDFDVTAILDTMELDDIMPSDPDHDHIYYKGVDAGLIEAHDGPFTVDIDTGAVHDYLEARRAAGQEGPITARRPRRSSEKVHADLDLIRQEQEALTRRTFEAGRDGTCAVVLEQFPDATEVHIYNWLEDEGEIGFVVESVWGPDGELWRTAEEDEEWEVRANEFAILTDRLGWEPLERPADDRHSTGWRGFKID